MTQDNDLKNEIKTLKNKIKNLEEKYGKFDSPDPLLSKTIKLLKDRSEISAKFLIKELQIGYSRAARILDQLEEKGLVGKAEGGKPRKVIEK